MTRASKPAGVSDPGYSFTQRRWSALNKIVAGRDLGTRQTTTAVILSEAKHP